MVVLMAVLIGVAVLAVLAFSLLTGPGAEEPPTETGNLRRLRRRREALEKSIADLRFERDSGLIPDEEHDELHAVLQRELKRATRRLALLRRARFRSLMRRREGVSPAERERIEARVAERRQARTATTSTGGRA